VTIPYRGTTGAGTYFVTASTGEKESVLQSEPMPKLFVDVLFHYQKPSQYQLHEFVVMPNHFYTLLTPLLLLILEKTIQLVKGGFSYRARKESGLYREIWQTSFYDHRVRDEHEYARFRHYIHMNPVRRGSVPNPEEFPYSSAILKLDEVPQWLKPAA
jgi:putative transposase